MNYETGTYVFFIRATLHGGSVARGMIEDYDPVYVWVRYDGGTYKKPVAEVFKHEEQAENYLNYLHISEDK